MLANFLTNLNTARLWLGNLFSGLLSHPDTLLWVGNVAKVALLGIVVFSIKDHSKSILIILMEVLILVALLDALILWMKKTTGTKKEKWFLLPGLWYLIKIVLFRYLIWTFTWRRRSNDIIEIY